MSQGRSTPGGGGGGEGSQRPESPVILADGNGESSANATMEEMLRVLQRQINEETARSASSAPSSPSSSARGVARMFLGKAKSSSATSSRTRRSPATSSRGERAASDLVGTSGSALVAPARTGSVQESRPEQPARTGSVQESRPEQYEAAPTRSDFGAMMRSAVVKIQDDDREVQPVFNEMQQAMTGLMEVTYEEAPNPPKLPQQFATKWPHDDADPSGSALMDDPVILASGYADPLDSRVMDDPVLMTSGNRMSKHLDKKKGLMPYHTYSANEFAVRWSMKTDEISYPLYAEMLGQAGPPTKLQKEWDDIRVVRRLRPLRDSEKSSAQSYYKMVQNSVRNEKRMPIPIYGMSLKDKRNEERADRFKIPENLSCPLCSKIMVDPVTITTGKTFDRECLRAWFHEKGHTCPVTLKPVSSTVLRNERVEWRQAEEA
ncbi:hypothetical protein EJB05_21630 [Eragrostis curvula]|uniref:U-box domain-containing protein n=1 Tax=Eragrostis curvula TaxID=38414 RepID=A0A5J9V3G4_9POAL|nr:hypothetical protein EJB05_21630 [Eragrostis curvula]